MAKPSIDRQVLEDLFFKCLRQEAELEQEATLFIEVEGLTIRPIFHKQRVEEAIPEILLMLEALPIEFMDARHEGGGGGWTFLNMPIDRNEILWGQQMDAQHLLLLAIACGHGCYCIAEREFWRSLPGGVPYFMWSREKYPR